jgi:hypothetical protein
LFVNLAGYWASCGSLSKLWRLAAAAAAAAAAAFNCKAACVAAVYILMLKSTDG